MFSKTTDAMRSIATKLTTATTYAQKALKTGSHFVKTGTVGYVHMITDAFAASVTAYEQAIQADSVGGTVSAAFTGFVESMIAGVHMGAASTLASDFVGMARSRPVAGRLFAATVGRLLLFLSVGYVYERLRNAEKITADAEELTDEMDVIYLNSEGDIIDAEATEATAD